VTLQSENGMLGMGPFHTRARRTPTDQRRQADHYRAAAIELLLLGDSFAMIRGGHIDLSIWRMQVSENGDLANWMVPGKMVKAWAGP